MIKLAEAVRDITLDEPYGPGPGALHFPQCGVTAFPGPETMRMAGERRLVVCFQQEAHYLADELVRPGGQPKRPQLPVLFGNVFPLGRREPVALVAHRLDDGVDLLLGHTVRGL